MTVLCGVLVLSYVVTAQPSAGESKSAFVQPSFKDLPTTRPFVSIDPGFSISLPNPTYSNTWIFQEGRITVAIARGSVNGSKEELMDIAKIYNQEISSGGGRIKNESFCEEQNLPVSYTHFAFGDGRFGFKKLILAKSRLFIVIATFENSSDVKFLERAFETFKIIGDEEIVSEINRKLSEATPKELPQEPVSKGYFPDTKEENLKGKVKTIVEESKTINKGFLKTRKFSEIRDYGKNGNLTKIVKFDYRGNPSSIEVYGFIDGKRVFKTGYISYQYNPRITVLKARPKRDLRYSTSYERKYEGENLVEVIYYGNDGILRSRVVSKYEKGQVETLSYFSDGRLARKFITIHDRSGLVINQKHFDITTGKIDADKVYSYIYEFDERGNWIKRISLAEKTKDGKTLRTPTLVTHRTINYYKQ